VFSGWRGWWITRTDTNFCLHVAAEMRSGYMKWETCYQMYLEDHLPRHRLVRCSRNQRRSVLSRRGAQRTRHVTNLTPGHTRHVCAGFRGMEQSVRTNLIKVILNQNVAAKLYRLPGVYFDHTRQDSRLVFSTGSELAAQLCRGFLVFI
jgi:hypothetical protein